MIGMKEESIFLEEGKQKKVFPEALSSIKKGRKLMAVQGKGH